MTANEITALASIASELLKVAESLSALAASEQQVVEVPAPKAPKAVKTESVKPTKTTKAKTKKHAKNANWYDRFASENTTLTVDNKHVYVTVARGHADEWKSELKSAGFTWYWQERCYRATLNDVQREKQAQKNREMMALTAGMTREEEREFYRARRAARRTA